ncbi:hypothetical protein P3T73_17000 [Kiritimatiellota bacterium B12222]|nr:hypothetical protein P3T73_17000 [Kiritimatiellota bacterium B12222]
MKNIPLCLFAVCCVSWSLFASSPEVPPLKFSESYVKYNPMNGKAEVILYNLQSLSEGPLDEATFLKRFPLSEFELTSYQFIEPEEGAPDGFTVVKLQAQTKNFMKNAPLEQLWGAVLGSSVKVTLEGDPDEKKMKVMFPLQENFYVAENNALRVLQNEEQGLVLMEFDLSDFPSEPFEAVMGWKAPAVIPPSWEEAYQHDADIMRLRHVDYYGALIEEYHQRTGSYPLQGLSEFPNYVHVAAPHQQKYAKGGPPYQHEVTDVETFRKVLELGLGREIDLKFDPQKVPVSAPNFYIYMIQGEAYFFAVHLYHPYPFANALGPHYHKLEISNQKSQRRGLWQPDQLMKDEAYQKAMSETPVKEAFFMQLEKQYH